jgi:hypothetical protein
MLCLLARRGHGQGITRVVALSLMHGWLSLPLAWTIQVLILVINVQPAMPNRMMGALD